MRGEYNTKQKRELLHFLKDHNLENFSVDDVVFRLEQQGTRVGRTTAYRYLETLSEQGNVRKYQNAQGVTQYQHIANDRDCASHFHMLCTNCGVLLHVNCDLMKTLGDHILEDHGFLLDARKTVLMGLCKKCASEKKEAR